MKIGILGGSFDPPHNGHLHVAKTLLKNKYCEKVIFMPCFKHPFSKLLTPSYHRLAMTKLLIVHNVIPAKAGIQQPTRFPIKACPVLDTGSGMTKTRRMSKLLERRSIEVSDIEIKKEKISYTIDTLNSLKTQSPKDDFVWIIGEDQVTDFEKWKDWQEIIKMFGLLVVPRSTWKEPIQSPSRWPDGLLEGGRVFVSFRPLNVSSTTIRKRIKQGLPIDNLVPKEVEKYIIQNKLYK